MKKEDRKETQLVPELAVRIGNLINEAKCVTGKVLSASLN